MGARSASDIINLVLGSRTALLYIIFARTILLFKVVVFPLSKKSWVKIFRRDIFYIRVCVLYISLDVIIDLGLG